MNVSFRARTCIFTISLAALLGGIVTSARALDLELAPLFRDHAILQQGKPVPVWGSANPNDKVEVTFKGQKVSAVADANGRWQATLPPLTASDQPADLIVKSRDKTLTVHDVLVGEVWLCSGQSNMEWHVQLVNNAEEEMANANYPLIRQFRVPLLASTTPITEFNSTWTPTTPKTVASYSAVAYFFARDLYQNLKVPIGIINASWGGKMIEVFMSPEAIADSSKSQAIDKRWEFEQKTLPERVVVWEKSKDSAATTDGTAKLDGETQSHPKHSDPRIATEQHRPSCLFNGMINPLIPYAIRGMLWYQGEQNISRADEYRSLFPAFIKDLREKFQQGDFPFYFAQLSSFEAKLDKTREGFALLREAQSQTLSLPNTGMAVTMDIGTPGNIHPRNKQDVGARLARWAKAKTYNLGGVYSGPVFKSAVRDGSSLRVEFDCAEGGLVAPNVPISSFEIAGIDGNFQSAQAEIKGNSLIVKSDDVKEPVAVRYAWGNAPVASLFNKEGLPASPFRYTLPGNQ